MLGMSQVIDLLGLVNSVHWCGNVLKREDGHVLRRSREEGEAGDDMEEVG